MLQMNQIDHIAITVSDLDRSLRFYRDLLGLPLHHEWPGEITMLRCGTTFVALSHKSQGKQSPASLPDITIEHFSFQVSRKVFEEAQKVLPAHGVEIEGISDHGLFHSLYFRDPDHHQLELVCYEMSNHR